jgi:hypothetical protein
MRTTLKTLSFAALRFKEPRRRRVCDLSVARCAEHLYAVRKLLPPLLHK